MGLGNKVPIAAFRVQISVTFVHFGRGSVKKGSSENHQNIECELHSY